MFFYSIYDRQLSRYVSPFLAPSDGAAMSMVRDSLVPGSILSTFADNFELHQVGIWNEEHGIQITGYSSVVTVDVGCSFPKSTIVCPISQLVLKGDSIDE